jgi:hypothetical protein
VNAKHRRLGPDQRFGSSDSGPHLRRTVTDESRQQRSRSELTMCGDDRANGIGRRLVVEQHITAAVDLNINEAWNQPYAFGQIMNRQRKRHVGARNNGNDPGSVNYYGRVLAQLHSIENAAGGDGVLGSSHRVRVTFCRWRG